MADPNPLNTLRAQRDSLLQASSHARQQEARLMTDRRWLSDDEYRQTNAARDTFTLIRTWVDEDHEGNPDEWPYPTEYTLSRIDGLLADRIRQRMGCATTSEVTVLETITSTGWSEFTQENDFEYELRCEDKVKRFGPGWSPSSGVGAMLRWLNMRDA